MRLPHALPWLLAMAWLMLCAFPAGFAAAEPSGPVYLTDEVNGCDDFPGETIHLVVSRQLNVRGGTIDCASNKDPPDRKVSGSDRVFGLFLRCEAMHAVGTFRT